MAVYDIDIGYQRMLAVPHIFDKNHRREDELEPYFHLWEVLGFEVESGVSEVVAVEYDATGDVPPVGKMTDRMSDRDEPEINSQPFMQESLYDFPGI